jgi:hypothetical protein
MSTPYSGSTSAGGHPGDTQSIPTVNSAMESNYAVSPDEQPSYAPHSGDMGTPMTDAGRPDVEGTSVGQLLGEVSKDLSTLMRQELELAKAELKTEAKKAGQGAGMFGAAGFAGYMVLLFLSFALWWALANVMSVWLAALIVAVLWGVIGAVSFVLGRKKFQEVNPKPERTVDTLQQVPGALKPH